MSASRIMDRKAALAPRVWLLSGDKAGDRAQLVTLAKALGWPFQEKYLRFNRCYKRSNIRLGASLASLDIAGSDALEPPWPDLILATGRRAVPVARWIVRQAGGKARIVHVGRPWAPLGSFDLVISTAQYQLPARANVIANRLTLNRPDAETLAAAARHWAPVFDRLQRPLVGVLVGGGARPFVLDRTVAAELGRAARSLAAALGGSLLVTTSPRTAAPAVEALFQELPETAFRHRFDSGSENPYLGILALADRFVVTGDSASMLTEACASGKPVHLFRLPERPNRKMRFLRAARRFCLGPGGDRQGLSASAYAALLSSGALAGSTRDMRLFHERLAAHGLVRPLDDLSGAPNTMADDELQHAVMRIHALFENGSAGTAPAAALSSVES